MKENGMHDASDLDRAERDERHNPPSEVECRVCHVTFVDPPLFQNGVCPICLDLAGPAPSPLWRELLAAANEQVPASKRLSRAVDALTIAASTGTGGEG